MSDKSVLIVDGDLEYARALAAHLVAEGVRVDIAVDTNQAALKLNAMSPDLVFLALRLPGGGAVHFHRLVSRRMAMTPVIYLAESDADDAVNLARQTGASDCVTKSDDAADVMATVRRYLFNVEEQASVLRSNNSVRVLAVEDDEDHRDTIAEALNAPGREQLELTFAHTVADACTLLRTDQYDCVILDHNLPDGGGLDVLSNVEERLLTTPVIGLSTSGDPDVAMGDFRGGAVEFIQKHEVFGDGSLRRRVFEALARYRRRRTASLIESRRRAAGIIKSDEQLVAEARCDALMGIFNRNTFGDCHADVHRRAEGERVSYAIVMADVDYFKKYNDHYGHAAGDEALRRVAGALRSTLRAGDLIGRYGGEEIIVLLDRVGESDAVSIGRRLCESVASMDIEHKHNVPHARVTVSMGVAVFIPESGEGTDQIIERADRALYEAKRAGRNCAVKAEPRLCHTELSNAE